MFDVLYMMLGGVCIDNPLLVDLLYLIEHYLFIS